MHDVAYLLKITLFYCSFNVTNAGSLSTPKGTVNLHITNVRLLSSSVFSCVRSSNAGLGLLALKALFYSTLLSWVHYAGINKVCCLCAPRTHRITITNFCLGKHLVSEDDLLKDQRGSPAYISPDVLSGERKRSWISCVTAPVSGIVSCYCDVRVAYWSVFVCSFFVVTAVRLLYFLYVWCKDVPCKMWSRLDHYILLEEQSSCQTNSSVGIIT